MHCNTNRLRPGAQVTLTDTEAVCSLLQHNTRLNTASWWVSPELSLPLRLLLFIVKLLLGWRHPF